MSTQHCAIIFRGSPWRTHEQPWLMLTQLTAHWVPRLALHPHRLIQSHDPFITAIIPFSEAQHEAEKGKAIYLPELHDW